MTTRPISADPRAGRANGSDPRRGSSLVELIVAILIFAVAVLGMIQMGVVSRQQTKAGELKTRMWSVASVKMEELRLVPFNELSGGEDEVDGFPMKWSVTGVEPKTVTLLISRPGLLNGQAVDTFVTVIADWGAQ